MNSKEWDERARNSNTLREAVWQTGAFVQHDRDVRNILSLWKDKKVLDVACGWGRFAGIFKPENYLGVDFSPEMIRIAKEKFPKYKFECLDFDQINDKDYDLVFEVISLGPMSLSEKKFVNKFTKAKAIGMFQADDFRIVYQYKETDTNEEREEWSKKHE